jgi:hypothetical protein
VNDQQGAGKGPASRLAWRWRVTCHRLIGADQSLRFVQSSPSDARRRLTTETLKRLPVAASIRTAISLLV